MHRVFLPATMMIPDSCMGHAGVRDDMITYCKWSEEARAQDTSRSGPVEQQRHFGA